MEFKPGFRLSLTDIIILIIGGIVAAYFAVIEAIISLIITFVVGHFFLFCNVFRISRPPELLWAAIFSCLSVMTLTTGFPGWAVTFSSSIVLTVIIIIRGAILPSYHGILWRKINPELKQRWERSRDIKGL